MAVGKNKPAFELFDGSITERFSIESAEFFPYLIDDKSNLIGKNRSFLAMLVQKFISNASENKIKIDNYPVFYQKSHFSIQVYFLGNDSEAHRVETDAFLRSILISKDNFGYLMEYSIIPSETKGATQIRLTRNSDETYCHLEFDWEITYNIESVSAERISGWVFNKKLPGQPISLHVTENGRIKETFEVNGFRGDVEAVHGAEQGVPFSGFSAQFTNKSQLPIYARNIVVEGSNISLIEAPQIYVNDGSGTGVSQKIRRHFMGLQFESLIEKNITDTLMRQIGPKLINGILRSSAQINSVKNIDYRFEQSLSVIIPVYSGYNETIACIEAVLNSKTDLYIEILIGFDAGPDLKLLEYLQSITDKRVKLVVNETNLGFVGNVNKLVSMKNCYDFLLLNADTIIGDYLFDRLLSNLNLNRDYACITPMGSNATIFTYLNVASQDETEIASVVKTMNANLSSLGRLVATPVAHGYCMLVNGTAYAKIGLFDLEAWGRGYGEEVDWCLTAFSQLGLVSGCYTGCFVYHAGNVSFGSQISHARSEAAQSKLESRHPGFSSEIRLYEYEGELNHDKIRIDLSLGRAGRLSAKSLIITHGFGGGVETFVKGRIKEIAAGGDVLVARVQIELGARFWVVEGQSVGRRIFPIERPEAFLGWLKALGLSKMYVEHIGHGTLSEVQYIIDGMKIETEVMLHDFSLICPKINLVDYRSSYCGVRDPGSCEICVSRSGAHDAMHHAMSEVRSVDNLRKASARLLESATTVVAPSRSTKSLYNIAFPQQKIGVRKHHADSKFVQREAISTYSKTVAVFGAVSEVKGLYRYKELAEYLEKTKSEIKIVIFGYTSNNEVFASNKNVKITGSYKNREELADLIEYHDPKACLHFAVWPETFSYTLSESLSFGLYPFYHAIGAIKERLSSLKIGKMYKIDQDVAQIAKDLERFFKDGGHV